MEDLNLTYDKVLMFLILTIVTITLLIPKYNNNSNCHFHLLYQSKLKTKIKKNVVNEFSLKVTFRNIIHNFINEYLILYITAIKISLSNNSSLLTG